MKPRSLFLAVLSAVAVLHLTGCQSLFHDASTRVKVVRPDGLTVEYQSPKDQHVEYDPATGRFLIRSATNAALAESAASAQAEANKALVEVVAEVLARVPPVAP